MECADFENLLKVIVVGNEQVGKTSLVTRFVKGRYGGGNKKSIGADFMEKEIYLPDLRESVNLMIWEMESDEGLERLSSRYYRGAGAAIYVFSTIDRDSFEDLIMWQRKVKIECGDIIQVLVQNKIDLIDDSVIHHRHVEDMARRMDVKLYRACARENSNVRAVFEDVARTYLKAQIAPKQEKPYVNLSSYGRTLDDDGQQSFDEDSLRCQRFLDDSDGEEYAQITPRSHSSSTASVNVVGDDEDENEPRFPSKQRTGGKKKKRFVKRLSSTS